MKCCCWLAIALFLLITVLAGKGYPLDIHTFNPIGNLLDRIEKQIPGLEIKGFLQNKTFLDLHGPSGAKGRGRVKKEWDFQMIEWGAELELRYRISPHLELINIENFLYDSLYDWDKDHGLPRAVEREWEYYHSFEQIMRELYLNIHWHNWFFKLGKQQVVWGKMDGKVIDIISPEDLREAVNNDQDDFEWRRIPSWMANIFYFWSDYYLNFIWIPDFEPSIGPGQGSVWWFPGLPPTSPTLKPVTYTTDKPSATFINHEWGLRFDVVKKGWDMSFIYFYTWDDRPTAFRRGYSIEPDGRLRIYAEPKHTRLHQFGASADKGFWFLNRDWVWRIESLYTLNDYIATEGEPLSADGVTKRDHLLTFSSLETYWWNGEIWTFFQPMWFYQFGYSGQWRNLGKKAERSDFSLVFSFSKRWYEDRLSIGSSLFFPLDQGGSKIELFLSWTFSDYLVGQVKYSNFSGNSDDLVGMYRDWDNLSFNLKYSF